MKEKSEAKARNNPNYLHRIFFSIIILGILLTIKGWVISYFSNPFIMPIIFSTMIVLTFCILAVNIHQLFMNQEHHPNELDEKKVQLYMYKQLKKMETNIPKAIQDSNTASYKMLELQNKEILEDVKKNQVLASKAVIKKLEDRINQLESINTTCLELLQKQKDENSELRKQINTLQELNIETTPVINEERTQGVSPMAIPDVNDEFYDPNKQLTQEEIAAMFANIN